MSKKIFFFDSFLISKFFLSGKSTFSSDDIFLLCKVCNNSFDERSKIIWKRFLHTILWKEFFCYKIILKLNQLNNSQKIVKIVGRTLIEPTHES